MKANHVVFGHDALEGSNGRRRYILMGTPQHTNIGDRAIAYAEIEFIKKIDAHATIIEVPYGSDLSTLDVNDNDLLILHGGGNFGDIWPDEEVYRQEIIKAFSDKHIVMMPQTMFFSDELFIAKYAVAYARCKNLTLIAREKKSYYMMKKFFSANKVMLLPDIVLSLSTKKRMFFNPSREHAMFVVRQDVEKTVSDSLVHQTESILKNELGVNNFVYTDMRCDIREAMLNSHEFITKYKLDQFSRAKVVITDRLHGMIFAVLSNIPCLVFDSKTHKTRGVYEWIADICGDSVMFCDDKSQLQDSLGRLLRSKVRPNRLNQLKPEWDKLRALLMK